MKFNLKVLIFGSLWLANFGLSFSMSTCLHLSDSIGIRKENNATFILHRVEPKETFYAISRKYDIPVETIINYNKEYEEVLSVGQVIKVPLVDTDKVKKKIIHTVAPQETLFAVSRLYMASIDDIKKWNNLSSNNIEIGQQLVIFPNTLPEVNNKPEVVSDTLATIKNNAVVKKENTQTKQKPNNNNPEPKKLTPSTDRDEFGQIIHIVDSGQTLYQIAKLYVKNVDEIKAWNMLDSDDVIIGQQLTIGPKKGKKVIEKVTKEDTSIVKSSSPEKIEKTNPNKIFENGLAKIIKGTETSTKFLALHKTAPMGTVMEIRNEMNDKKVFVRVVGVLPDTGNNEKILVKISKAAYDKLGGVDTSFPVEVSYLP